MATLEKGTKRYWEFPNSSIIAWNDIKVQVESQGYAYPSNTSQDVVSMTTNPSLSVLPSHLIKWSDKLLQLCEIFFQRTNYHLAGTFTFPRTKSLGKLKFWEQFMFQNPECQTKTNMCLLRISMSGWLNLIILFPFSVWPHWRNRFLLYTINLIAFIDLLRMDIQT